MPNNLLQKRKKKGPKTMPSQNRREFIKMGLGAFVGTMLPWAAMAKPLKGFDARRSLSFYNTHTDEKCEVCYFDEVGYRPEALNRINHILRDHRTDTIKEIDPNLLDLLFTLKCRISPRDPFHVISGYRSPQTNERLRRHSSGVAQKSFHTKGQAIDIRLPGYNTAQLRNLCVKMNAGGVGYYSQSDFVHIDIGPVRTW